MANRETNNIKSGEFKSLAERIEQETRRIINEHLPTVYSIKPNVDPTKRLLYSSQEVECHIRFFFDQVDKVIEQAGLELLSPKSVMGEFKLMVRRLYTVVGVECQTRAIEAGMAAALKIAKHPEKIWTVVPSSQSGCLFSRSAPLASVLPQEIEPSFEIRVILILDDVTHSGSQLAGLIGTYKAANSTWPIVVSVGAVTERARRRLGSILGPADQLLAQEHPLSLAEMIDQVSFIQRRNRLRQLAVRYFELQECSPIGAMEATHIITPFKLPDYLSNGELGGVVCDKVETNFTLLPAYVGDLKLYPSIL